MQTEIWIIFLLALRVKSYLWCFTQFTVDQSKLTVNGSVLSDTPNVRYLVALYPGSGVVLDLSIPDLCTLTYFLLKRVYFILSHSL